MGDHPFVEFLDQTTTDTSHRLRKSGTMDPAATSGCLLASRMNDEWKVTTGVGIVNEKAPPPGRGCVRVNTVYEVKKQ